MSTTKNYEIELGTIYKNGATCKLPTIVWETPECGAIWCDENDGKLIKVQIPDGCTEKCFYGTLTCTDVDCIICDPVVIKVCPCDIPGDCSACETCTDNLCISTCDEGEFCDPEDEICVECDDDHPCPCNQICVAGHCVCPPGSPYEDDKGCCSECNIANPCPNCEYCTPEGCVPVDCPVGVCNPDTGDCVDCNSTGDCTGDHECCVDNDCQCCAGYFRDPGTGLCVVEPECRKDGDCPNCEICNADGECEDLVPPSGYIVGNPDDGCIVKECDCDNPNCPYGSTCFPYDESTCYCRPCSGHCSDSEGCPEGCICNEEDDICEVNSCFGPCDPDNPCGEGCGCLDGWCIPCYTLDCDIDCDNAIGCNCNTGTCIDSGCSGSCDETNGCAGENCGCDQITHECVLCESTTCNDHGDCPLGCYCNGVACVPSPCQYSVCENPEDCGEGCTCLDGLCVPCSVFTCAECGDIPGCNCSGSVCGDEPPTLCADDFILQIEDECKLVAELETGDCCACPNNFLHVHSVYSGAADTLTVTGFLRTGNLAASPLLSTLNIENGLPTQGSVGLQLEYKTVRAGLGITSVISGGTGTFDFTGVDSASAVVFSSVYDVGDIITSGGHDWTVTEICLVATNTVIFEYENECRSDYGTKHLFCIDLADGVSKTIDISYLPKKLVRCKTPLFTLYKAATSSFSGATLIKRYATRVDATHYKVTYEYPDIEICKYYKVTSDCGCDTLAIYECA